MEIRLEPRFPLQQFYLPIVLYIQYPMANHRRKMCFGSKLMDKPYHNRIVIQSKRFVAPEIARPSSQGCIMGDIVAKEYIFHPNYLVFDKQSLCEL